MDELVQNFGQGASLSFEHFEAFFRASPLTGYSVQKVTRLTTRPIEARDDPGTPFFEVDLTLQYGKARSREVVTVLGEVLPVVQIEPDRLFLKLPDGSKRITVDGIETAVRSAKIFDGSRAYPVLLLRGRHVIEVGGSAATIETMPVAVVAGDAAVERGGDQSAIVRVG